MFDSLMDDEGWLGGLPVLKAEILHRHPGRREEATVIEFGQGKWCRSKRGRRCYATAAFTQKPRLGIELSYASTDFRIGTLHGMAYAGALNNYVERPSAEYIDPIA